jgi:N-acetylneuraminic acid mutarotase
MIRRDLASCADIDISPLRLGNKDVLAITVAQPHPHGMNLCYRPGNGESSPHNNSARAKAPHRPPNGEETHMPWTNEPPLKDPRYFPAAAACNAPAPASGSGVYAIGGIDTSSSQTGEPATTVEFYDTAQKTWSTTTSIPNPLRQNFGAASTGGKLHIVGGYDDSYTPLATHDVFDPATNTWSSLAPLSTASGNLAAVTGSDGFIYAIGGSSQGPSSLATVEAYDPVHDEWVPKQQMQTGRMGLAAAATSNGFIYAIGGLATNTVLLNSVEVFDIAANSWTPSPQSLPLPTAWHAAAVGPNGLIYVIGGMQQQPNAPSTSPPPYVASVYSYNPASPTSAWAEQAPLPDVRAGMGAATGADGLVYAIGGMTCPQKVIVGEVNAYTFDKCDYIEYKLGLATQQMAAAQATLDGGDLTPQQRAAGEKSLLGLRIEIETIEKALATCRG